MDSVWLGISIKVAILVGAGIFIYFVQKKREKTNQTDKPFIMTPNQKITCLAMALSALMFAMPVSSNAQKSKYIGWYQNNNIGGDTLSGYMLLGLDSFKLMYTIDVNDRKEMRSRIGAGTWSLIKRDGKDIGLLHFKDTTIEVSFATFIMGGDGGLSGGKGTTVDFNKKTFTCFTPHPSREL
jgi:hypothetical protein